MKASLPAFLLLSLTANALPETPAQVEADARKILEHCKADRLIGVTALTTDDGLLIKIKPLKKPSHRTERDLLALRCVGNQYAGSIDFRPLASALLGMNKP